MTYDHTDMCRDDIGRPRQPVFSNLDDINDGATHPRELADALAELSWLRTEEERLERELRQVREQHTLLRTLVGPRAGHGTSTLGDAVHTTLADQFRDVVQQDMQHIARQLLGKGPHHDAPQKLALLISALCRALLGEQGSATHTCLSLGIDPDVHASRLSGLTAKTRAITERITPDVWDFHTTTGTRLDPSQQHAWGQCDSRHPIKFVVAPAYRINNRTYALQAVFTAPKSRWRW